MNVWHAIGNLASDPELRSIPSGTQVCNFTVAVNRKYKGKDETIFMPCEAWGKKGEVIHKYFEKGKPIAITGELRQEYWESDGVRRTRIKTTVNDFYFLPKNGGSSSSKATQTNNDTNMVASSDDEIPF